MQDLSASQAVGFVFQLKHALEQEVETEPSSSVAEEMRALHARIDRIALEAFEVYCACREQIYEIRAGALRRQTAKLQEFVDRCYGASAPDSDGSEHPNENGGGSRA